MDLIGVQVGKSKKLIGFIFIGLCVMSAFLVGCNQTISNEPRARSDSSIDTSKDKAALAAALKEPTGNGLQLFNALLERYGRAKTYQSVANIKFTTDGQEDNPIVSERVIFYSKPNKHRISTISGDLVSTSVSDGQILGEYNSTAAELLRSAPTTAEQTATMISNFNFCGSLLYDFFAGPERARDILEAGNTQIRRQKTDKDGIVLLSFKARAPYGTTEMRVDERKSEILEIKSLMEPVVLQSSGVEEKFKLKSILLIEKYDKIKFDGAIKEAAFKFDPPANLEVRDRRSEQDALSLQNGVPAPEFTLETLNKKTVSLQSLRGQVVMIDFWASWCDPCREMIPYQMDLVTRFASKGLASCTLVYEEPELVKIALRELGILRIDPLLDTGKKIQELYKVVQFPTYIFVDRQGRVSSVLVGKQDTKQIQIELKKAGLNLD